MIDKKTMNKLIRHNALSTLMVGLGTIALTNSATAAPLQDDFIVAQVGFGSTISPPVPLNLKPRTHIPLPQSNYSSDPSNNYYRDYNDHQRYHRHDHEHSHSQEYSNRGTIIIINPSSEGSQRDRTSNYSHYGDRGYIRVIRK
jgi:hypothetical protein